MVYAVLLVGHHRRGTDPEVIIQFCRWATRLLSADLAPSLDIPGFGHQHIPDHALPQHLDRFDHGRRATNLGAMLYHDLVTLRRFHQQPSFADIMRAGFFDVDMLARFTSQDRCRRVPVIGSRHDHTVDVLIIEDPSHVFDGGYLSAINGSGCRRQSLLIGIADMCDLYAILLIEEVLEIAAASTATDQGHIEGAVGISPAGRSELGCGGCHGTHLYTCPPVFGHWFPRDS